jgi:hypothetical protein
MEMNGARGSVVGWLEVDLWRLNVGLEDLLFTAKVLYV